MRIPFTTLISGVLLTGCVSTAIHNDLPQVRELARTSVPDGVVEGEVNASTDSQVLQALRQPVDVDAAVRIALAGNRELRALFREMGIARGRLLQAGVVPNPVVGVEFLPERNSRFELRVEYDITGLILAPASSRAASSEVDAARFRAAAAVVATGLEARADYYSFVAAEQKLAIAQQALDALAAARDAANAMRASGNAAEFTADVQIAAYERARVGVSEAELEVAHRRETLTRLFGIAGGEVIWHSSGSLPEAEHQLSVPDRVETTAIEASFALKEQRAHLEALGRQAGMASTAGWMPEIVADVHALLGHPESTETNSLGDDWRFGAGVDVRLPIFAQNRGMAGALSAEFDAQMERYIGTAVTVRSAAREARNRLVSAHARVRLYADVIVPAQQRVMEQALLQYNAMDLSVFELLNARREQLDVELARVETLAEYWTARAEFESVIAGALVHTREGAR
ncbi:MAG: TolC family protein [Sandaracinaceae bacterium]|nr:TolC family protein [Sandaracinaceae bacterium]